MFAWYFELWHDVQEEFSDECGLEHREAAIVPVFHTPVKL